MPVDVARAGDWGQAGEGAAKRLEWTRIAMLRARRVSRRIVALTEDEGPVRAMVLTPLIGLLASTGLRSGEALRLDRADVDLTGGVLHIRKTKFRKDRLVPVHSTTSGGAARLRPAAQLDLSGTEGPSIFPQFARQSAVVRGVAASIRRRLQDRWSRQGQDFAAA